MPTITRHERYIARPVIDRTDIRFDGLTGAEEDYGRVQIIRITTQERRASGDVGRLLDSRETEAVIIESMDADEAARLMASLGRALVDAHRVRPPR